MRVIVFGATGDLGCSAAAEALARGHQVTAVVRNLVRIPTTTIIKGE